MSTGAKANPSGRQRITTQTGSDARRGRPVRRVGKYRILSELGRGGMANVFLAVAQGPGGVNKLVVLKALLSELTSQPDALAMFLDEARLAARLNHPNVVQTYEVGTEGDRHVIVMEYLEGQSFSSVLKRGEAAGRPVSLAMQLRVISAVLEGLHYAHELSDYDGSSLGLVHRDVSPQNVFVTYDGQVKVLDFGIAKAASSSTNTATGIIKGKIAYMSPEQMIGDPVDRRADLYSVGCMLWASAGGSKLWKDTPDVHVMRQVINAEIASPRSINPSCDEELERIVMKALASTPAARYGTALELQADIDKYCESFSSPIKPKEIGAAVSTLFADTRAELKAIVDRQLALVAEATSLDDLSLSAVRDSLEAPDAGQPSVEPPQEVTLHAQPQRTKLGYLALAVAVLLLTTFALTRARSGEVTAPASAVVATGPAAPELTTVQLNAVPSNARLYLDEQALPGNPASIPLALDGSPRRLRAEADGYETGESTFVVTRDRHIELVLKPVAAATTSAAPVDTSKPSHHAVGTSTSTTPTHHAGTKPKPSSNCEQPFFVDVDGIRKMRPECM